MASDLGIKLGVEGEKAFKQAIRDINSEFKVLGSEMNLVTAEFGKQNDSVEALTAKSEVLNKEIATQNRKIESLTAALENASESFGENDRRTQQWQIELNNAKAALAGMENELSDTEEKLKKSGEEFEEAGNSAEDMAEEISDAAEKTEEAGSSFEALGNIVKGVGATMASAFAAVGATAVSAAKSLTDMSVGGAAYADTILTDATVTGMSTESLQAYTYAADLVDVSMQTLTGSMAKNVKAMSSAAEGSAAYVEAYEKLGVSIMDAEGNLRDSEEVYWEVIDALATVENETERDALAMTLFGKSAQALNPLIAQGSAGIAELTEEAKQMGAVLSEDQLSRFGGFDDAIQRLTAGSSAAKNALGLVLLPELQTLADEGVSLLGEFTSGLVAADGDWEKMSVVVTDTVKSVIKGANKLLPDILDTVMEVLGAVGGAILDSLPDLVDTIGELGQTLLSAFLEALPMLTEGAVQLILTLVQAIVDTLPAIVEAGMQMVAQLAAGIGESIPVLIPTILEAITTIIQTIIENLGQILDAGLSIIMGLTEGIIAAIPVLIEALPELILSILEFLLGAIPQIIEAGVQLLSSLVDALPEIIALIVEVLPQIIDSIIKTLLTMLPDIINAGLELFVALVEDLPTIIKLIVEAIPQIISGIVDALMNNMDAIIDAGVDLFIGLIENLPLIIKEIVKAIPQIVTGIVECLGKLAYKLVNAGGDLIKGLWEGISEAGDWLWDKVTGFFGGVVDGIKDFLGIHSPSRVFAEIGGYMGEGIGVGFEDAMSDVEKDMKKAVPTEFDIDTSLNGLNDFSINDNTRAVDVTIPLMIDGTVLTEVVARLQWSENRMYVRNLGTV